jgi:hypothetical protein
MTWRKSHGFVAGLKIRHNTDRGCKRDTDVEALLNFITALACTFYAHIVESYPVHPGATLREFTHLTGLRECMSCCKKYEIYA